MTVYLLHFDQALPRGVARNGSPLQAQHYIGYADDLGERLAAHLKGQGARITQVCLERGIHFQLVRTWDGEGRTFERKLKNQKNAPKLCPICSAKELPL